MASSDSTSDSKSGARVDPKSIGSPKGTRDFYPEDLLRRRYITEVWRAVSIRHGFEEIDGPTFEHSELYAVKSGEGILGELFQAFSGKAEEEREQVRETGNAPFALRPEFTPTLARMYAARAKQLPKPVRWFCVPNFFRAEKPQRGRLREFMQWNVDVIGGEGPDDVYDVTSLIASTLEHFGLSADVAKIKFGDRKMSEAFATRIGAPIESTPACFEFLDNAAKWDSKRKQEFLSANGLPDDLEQRFASITQQLKDQLQGSPDATDIMGIPYELGVEQQALGKLALSNRVFFERAVFYCFEIVRGLAYYTGTVFELIAEGERAVAGGGRYDNLIELFGGPPTPACGFGMGDVVLGNLLDDHGLMPADGAEMMDAIQRTVSGLSLRPEVFVVLGGEEHEPLVRPLLANLRAGIEADGFEGKPWDAARFDANAGGVRPMHARTTSKSTQNLKKLLADAERQHARFVVIIHGDDKVQVKDLDRRDELPENYHVRPDASAQPEVAQGGYVGRAILERLAQSI